MNMDELIKYVLWIVIFGIALVGIHALFKRLGVL